MSSQGAGPSERRVGRYHLAEGLGGGPTGEVFRAKVYGVAGLERQFAVKRFHPELVSNPDRAALLAHAARVYGGLQHPRIARLHEFGVAGGETFAACELVRGIDLVRLLALAGERGGGLQPGAGAALIAAAARAIGFAHVRGLSHLGVCPSNVICTADGDVKVTDFGYLGLRLPVRPADDPGLVSRIRYLAPEQLRGEPGSLATDVFQLGLLACELLTGKAPLAGVDPHDLQRRAQAGELPVVALDLPRPLTQVIRRALAISPRERFADAGALADSLDAATRAAPLAGDRREVAALVRSAVEQPLASPGSERAASGAPLVPSPAASRATLTGRPPSMQRPARVESPSSNGDRGRSQQPAGGLQAGQVIMLPRPAVVPASVGDAARSAAESRPAPAESPRPPVLPRRADTSEEPTHVKEEAHATGAHGRVARSSAGGGGEDPGPPTRVMPEQMARTLIGQPAPEVSSNGKRRPAQRGAPGRQPERGPGAAETADDEGSPTQPLFREDLPPDAPDSFARESDSDFYVLETATRAPTEDSLSAALKALSAPERADSSTPLPDVRSPPPDILTPMPELHDLATMLHSRPGQSSSPPPVSPPMWPARGTAPGPSVSAFPDPRMPAPLPGMIRPPEARLPVVPLATPLNQTAPASPPPMPTMPDLRMRRAAATRPPPLAPLPFDPRMSPRPDLPADPRFAIDTGSLPEPLVPPPFPPMTPPAPRLPEKGGRRPAPRSQMSSGPDTGEVVATGQLPRSDRASIGPPAEDDRPRTGARGSRGLGAALVALLLLALAGGGYLGYVRMFAGEGATAKPPGAKASADASKSPVAAPRIDSSSPASPSSPSSAEPASASSAAPAGSAAIGSAPPGEQPPQLVITSQPGGARVYIDGAPVGRTPLILEPTADRHKVALIEPGYKPHTAEIDGRGTVSVALEEVTPPNGPAGIKIRCRQKNRYYVTLDGEPTGQLCPTERLGVELGDHTAEIYDPVTDSRRAYKVHVRQTRLSVRVRVD